MYTYAVLSIEYAYKRIITQNIVWTFMKTAVYALFFTLVFASCASGPAYGPDELDSAIRGASNYLNTNIPAGNKIVILNIQSDSTILSDYIIEELVANAVNDKIFTVVDRAQLDVIREEQNFQLSGEVDDNTALSIGRFLGAQTIVSGRLSTVIDQYRLSIRALEVQTAQVQGQYNRNIAAGRTITSLMISGGGTAAALGRRPAGSKQTAPAQAPAPDLAQSPEQTPTDIAAPLPEQTPAQTPAQDLAQAPAKPARTVSRTDDKIRSFSIKHNIPYNIISNANAGWYNTYHVSMELFELQYAVNNSLNIVINPRFFTSYDDEPRPTHERFSKEFIFNFMPGLLWRPWKSRLKGWYLGVYMPIGWASIQSNEIYDSETGYRKQVQEYDDNYFLLGIGGGAGYQLIFKNGFTISLGIYLQKIWGIPSENNTYKFDITSNTSDIQYYDYPSLYVYVPVMLDLRLGWSF